MNIKKGDTVKVIAGKDKGAEGKVIEVLREEQRVIVEGVNRVKKHTKVVNQGGRAGTTGGIVTAEAPIHVSNVMLVEGDGVTRVGFRRDEVTKRRPDGSTYKAAAQRPHLAQDRQGNLMTETADGDRDRSRPRLKQRYREEIVPALESEFEIANVMQIPGLVKIVVNMGVGEAARDSKLIDGAVRDLTAITGQKPQVTKARKSIAQFKLREGMPIGAHVTLRGDRMWEFLDRLLSLALPAHPRLPRPVAQAVRRPAATTRSVSPSRSCSTRSTRTGSTGRAAWTSRSSPPPPTTTRAGRCSSTSASRSRRTDMAKTALRVKAARKPKFAVRGYTRCQRCGRPKAVYRKFGLCRICLREMAHRGELPGVTKSCW